MHPLLIVFILTQQYWQRNNNYTNNIKAATTITTTKTIKQIILKYISIKIPIDGDNEINNNKKLWKE